MKKRNQCGGQKRLPQFSAWRERVNKAEIEDREKSSVGGKLGGLETNDSPLASTCWADER